MPVPHLFAGTAGGTTAQLDANFDYFARAIVTTTGGNVLLGTQTPAYAAGERISAAAASGANGIGVSVTGGGKGVGIYNAQSSGGTFGTMFEFQNFGGAVVGSVTANGSGTSYNTTSDYRLKTNMQPLTGSGAFIDALQPKAWQWVADGLPGVGFIAHEVQAVSPASVAGQKDAVDSEGQPVYQCMEYGSAEFMANIVAELKSLRARVAALEAA